MVSLYGPPDAQLLQDSYGTYWTALRLGDAALAIVPISNILANVMIAPNEQLKNVRAEAAHEDWWFLVEKPGMKVSELIGRAEEDNDENI
jgi:hypothetical protein